MTAYGGLLPVATVLEKLGFQQLVEETVPLANLMCRVMGARLTHAAPDTRTTVPFPRRGPGVCDIVDRKSVV